MAQQARRVIQTNLLGRRVYITQEMGYASNIIGQHAGQEAEIVNVYLDEGVPVYTLLFSDGATATLSTNWVDGKHIKLVTGNTVEPVPDASQVYYAIAGYGEEEHPTKMVGIYSSKAGWNEAIDGFDSSGGWDIIETGVMVLDETVFNGKESYPFARTEGTPIRGVFEPKLPSAMDEE